VLYDSSVEGESERAEELAGEILVTCLEHGGSITGEHGVGADKKKHMPQMFTTADLDTMQLLRCAFDPDRLCNPDKVFPTPRLCGELPGPRTEHPIEAAGLAEIF
jgi:glycolate oxidase